MIGVSNDCIAVHGSDMAVAMAALDARVETVAADGATRTIPIDTLYLPPGDTPHIETVLAPGELIQSVVLPPPPPGQQLYRKVRDRASFAFALVSVAVIVGTKATGCVPRVSLSEASPTSHGDRRRPRRRSSAPP